MNRLTTVMLFLVGFLMQGCNTTTGLNALEGAGGLGGLSTAVRNITGQQNAIQMANMQINTVSSSLDNLQQRLPFIYSPQQGQQVYNTLSSAWTQLSGKPAVVQLIGQFATVDDVKIQIAYIKSYVQSQATYLNNMTTTQIQEFIQKLQTANGTISSAGTIGGGGFPGDPGAPPMMGGGYGGGMGGYGAPPMGGGYGGGYR